MPAVINKNKPKTKRPDLVCPAGTPASLRTAVDAGADSVYCGFQNQTNARNFPGLNFTPDEMADGIAYAHAKGSKVALTLNTFPPAGKTDLWREAADLAISFGIDAIIIADMGMARYICTTYPDQRLHLSVQAGAPSVESIKFYCEEFGVKRVVLPRILTIPEIKALREEVPCEIESFIFGNHGLMAEGRCSLTNYATGKSTNMDGVCSPPSDVQYVEDKKGETHARLGPYTIDCYSCSQSPGYPTICKGRYFSPAQNDAYYAFEEPLSLNLADLLPELIAAGVDAFKIEGRQRSKAYINAVVSAWRTAIDNVMNGREAGLADLLAFTEGQKQTQGAYQTKRWR